MNICSVQFQGYTRGFSAGWPENVIELNRRSQLLSYYLESFETRPPALVLPLDTQIFPNKLEWTGPVFGICPLILQSQLFTDISVTLAEAVRKENEYVLINIVSRNERWAWEARAGLQSRLWNQIVVWPWTCHFSYPAFIFLVWKIEGVKPGTLCASLQCCCPVIQQSYSYSVG